MLNVCMKGFVKAAGLAILALCVGIIVGRCVPPFWIAVLELAVLAVFGYLCLFKW